MDDEPRHVGERLDHVVARPAVVAGVLVGDHRGVHLVHGDDHLLHAEGEGEEGEGEERVLAAVPVLGDASLDPILIRGNGGTGGGREGEGGERGESGGQYFTWRCGQKGEGEEKEWGEGGGGGGLG
jgi:hypothetical protein